jgi:hypothetical protein
MGHPSRMCIRAANPATRMDLKSQGLEAEGQKAASPCVLWSIGSSASYEAQLKLRTNQVGTVQQPEQEQGQPELRLPKPSRPGPPAAAGGRRED